MITSTTCAHAAGCSPACLGGATASRPRCRLLAEAIAKKQKQAIKYAEDLERLTVSIDIILQGIGICFWDCFGGLP